VNKNLSLSSSMIVFGLLWACSAPRNNSNITVAYGDKLRSNSVLIRSTFALLPANPEQKIPYCTAVLIAPQLLLTAAHCLDFDRPELRLGYGPDMMNPSGILTGRGIAHESYDAPYNEPFSFDIGMIRLDSPVSAPLLPLALAQEEDFSVGTTVTVLGYGVSTTSKSADSVFVEDNTRLFKTEANIQRIYRTNDEDDVSEYGLFVSQSLDGKSALCEGDSGGPVLLKRGDDWVVAGITVGGMGQCATEAFHTNIDFYQPWIAASSSSLLNPGSGEFPAFLKNLELPHLFENADFALNYRMTDEQRKDIVTRKSPLADTYDPDRLRKYHVITITHLPSQTQYLAFATFDDVDDGGNTLGWVQDRFGRVVSRIDDSFFNPLARK